jgi:hypothetical protein
MLYLCHTNTIHIRGTEKNILKKQSIKQNRAKTEQKTQIFGKIKSIP